MEFFNFFHEYKKKIRELNIQDLELISGGKVKYETAREVAGKYVGKAAGMFSGFFTDGALEGGVVAYTVALLFLVNYTNKTIVEDQLLPTTSVVRVYPMEIGFIANRSVEEGSLV